MTTSQAVGWLVGWLVDLAEIRVSGHYVKKVGRYSYEMMLYTKKHPVHRSDGRLGGVNFGQSAKITRLILMKVDR